MKALANATSRMLRAVLIVSLSLSGVAGFSVPSSRVASSDHARAAFRTSWPLQVLRAGKIAPEKDKKAVAEPLGEIEGLDGWLIKIGLKTDERVSALAVARKARTAFIVLDVCISLTTKWLLLCRRFLKASGSIP
jgi:hypothetical protein